MIDLYISPRILFFITIILILLGIHIFYGCCAITIDKNTTNTTSTNNNPFNTKDDLTNLYNKYTTEYHFYIPNTSLSREELKYIAHRGGNNM